MFSSEPTPQRIIVPIDRSAASEQAIPYARVLAVAGDTVVFVHVTGSNDGGGLPGRNQYKSAEPGAADAESHLVRLAASAGFPTGVTVETALLSGRAADAILTFKAETHATMIVMATAGRGAAGRLRFGSVADEVARTSNIPVVLVRLRDEEEAPSRVTLDRLVVPHDGSDRSDRALPQAAMLARRLDLPITILNVMEVSDLTKYEDPDQRPSAIEEFIAVEDEAVQERLSRAVSDLEANGVKASWKVVSGNWAAEAIEDEIGRHDFLVMASYGRRGVRRFLFGSVAEQLVRSGRTAVMLVPMVSDQD